MKNLKKIALGLLVGALAIGFSSFTNHASARKHRFDSQWFQLKSNVTPTRAHALDASNYELAASKPCPGADIYCGVFAANDSDQPVITGTAAQTQIEDYFDNDNQGTLISADDN